MDLVIDESHEAVIVKNTIVDFIAEASSRVVAFKALGRPTVGMEKGYLLPPMVLALLESLHSFLRHTFESVREYQEV